MHKLFSLVVLCQLMISSCNNGNKSDTATSKDSINNVATAKDSSDLKFSEEDSGDIELQTIVSDYKSEYNKTYNIDITFTRGNDTIRIAFNYQCLFDNGLTIPEKYVSIYGFNSFTTHNFDARLMLYKNSDKLLDKKITKSDFASITDESLKRYANLSYPSLKVEDSVVRIQFSISIPLTDVGIGVNYVSTFNGQTYVTN